MGCLIRTRSCDFLKISQLPRCAAKGGVKLNASPRYLATLGLYCGKSIIRERTLPPIYRPLAGRAVYYSDTEKFSSHCPALVALTTHCGVAP